MYTCVNCVHACECLWFAGKRRQKSVHLHLEQVRWRFNLLLPSVLWHSTANGNPKTKVTPRLTLQANRIAQFLATIPGVNKLTPGLLVRNAFLFGARIQSFKHTVCNTHSTYTFALVRAFTHTHTNTYAHTHTHICTGTHTHIHIHTYSKILTESVGAPQLWGRILWRPDHIPR